ncbi:Kinesin light chain [Paramyrothecium foliicola]|nr:Kinesin light chain [Paramyrothecium foliicola]
MELTRPVSRLGFEIAIICALTIEADAVEALFDQYWDDDHSFGKASGDPNAYTTGSIGCHNVVLAYMPGMGKANAAVVAVHCKASYPNIKLALIVGVCGAVPFVATTDTEIVLGDIIVSNGVVQYDFGRQLPERFVRKDTLLDSLGRPNTEIRAFLGKLEGIRSRQKLNNKIATHLAKLQAVPELKAQYPGTDNDKLFQSSYRHLNDGKTCEECGCDGQLTQRIRLEQPKIQPAVHFGLIASGDTVMKSGIERDQISQFEGVIGFEMESAGVWDTFPCIVIKGVCDYADSHKSKTWQRFAAGTSAACAKAFLEFWEPSVTIQIAERLPSKFIVPYPSNPGFVGRSDILQQLEDKLGHTQQANETSSPRVPLFGLGGVGKTQIALAYVYWLQKTVSTISILWVHASTADRFRQSYMSIAEEYQIPGHTDPQTDILLLVKNWLERRECEQWLMVLDNADDVQLFFGAYAESNPGGGLSNYLPECRHGSLLATTRNKQMGVKLAKGQKLIEISHMNQVESEQLLRTSLGGVNTTSADLWSLSSRLEHLPLALAQAASFIQETCITPLKYLQLLGESDDNVVQLLSKEFETVGRDSSAPRAVAQTWILSFQKIEQQNTLASELLSLMGLLDRQDIPEIFLMHFTQQREIQDSLYAIELIDALGILKSFSFLTEGMNGNYNMHRLIQLVTRKWLASNGTITHFYQKALTVISSLYPYGGYETRTVCAAYLSHANTVLQAGRFTSRNEAEAKATLMHRMAAYCNFEGWWDKAEMLSLEAVRIRGEVIGKKDPQTLASMSNLASIYSNQGRWEEAEQLELQVLEIRKTKLGEDHPDTLMSMSNLALTYSNQGRWGETQELQVQVLEIRKKKLGEQHPNTLTSISNLALTYSNQSRWEEAEQLQMQVLDASKIKLGEDHPDTLTSMANLASTYWSQGRWEEAEHLELQVLEIRKLKLGEDHPNTLISMANLALTYSNQGRWEEAEQLQMQVLETSKIKLREDQPDTLTSISNLALIYSNQSRWEEAEHLELQVLEIRKIKLGEDHPDTLTSMSNLAFIYWKQGRWEEAELLGRPRPLYY